MNRISDITVGEYYWVQSTPYAEWRVMKAAKHITHNEDEMDINYGFLLVETSSTLLTNPHNWDRMSIKRSYREVKPPHKELHPLESPNTFFEQGDLVWVNKELDASDLAYIQMHNPIEICPEKLKTVGVVMDCRIANKDSIETFLFDVVVAFGDDQYTLPAGALKNEIK